MNNRKQSGNRTHIDDTATEASDTATEASEVEKKSIR